MSTQGRPLRNRRRRQSMFGANPHAQRLGAWGHIFLAMAGAWTAFATVATFGLLARGSAVDLRWFSPTAVLAAVSAVAYSFATWIRNRTAAPSAVAASAPARVVSAPRPASAPAPRPAPAMAMDWDPAQLRLDLLSPTTAQAPAPAQPLPTPSPAPAVVPVIHPEEVA